MNDADVRLRGVTADGVLVEARLDRADTPGAYRGLIRFSSRSPQRLTLTIFRREAVAEIPVSAGGRTATPFSGR